MRMIQDTRWRIRGTRPGSPFTHPQFWAGITIKIDFTTPFLSIVYKIISQKHQQNRLSSPHASINFRNLNNPNLIPAKKSLHVYPCHSGILKKDGQNFRAARLPPSRPFAFKP
jgi:hypothetical protein